MGGVIVAVIDITALEKHVALQEAMLKRDKELLEKVKEIDVPLPEQEDLHYVEELALMEDLLNEQRKELKKYGFKDEYHPNVSFYSEWKRAQKKSNTLLRIAKIVQAAEMKQIGETKDLEYVVDKIIDESASIHYTKQDSSIMVYIRDPIHNTNLAMVELFVDERTCIVISVKVLE